MRIGRSDLYDFVMILDDQEFRDIKEVADFTNKSPESVLKDVVLCGFRILRKGELSKET